MPPIPLMPPASPPPPSQSAPPLSASRPQASPPASRPPAPGWLARLTLLVSLALGLFGCDFATKSAAKVSLEGQAPIAVAPSVLGERVALRYVQNEDIAFNALQRIGVPRSRGLLIGLSSVALLGFAVMALTTRRREVDANVPVGGASPASNRQDAPGPKAREARKGSFDPLAFGGAALVLSGALGNVFDRITRGYVIDFIELRGWPVFNVADVAVGVGMALFLVSRLRGGDDADDATAAPPPTSPPA